MSVNITPCRSQMLLLTLIPILNLLYHFILLIYIFMSQLAGLNSFWCLTYNQISYPGFTLKCMSWMVSPKVIWKSHIRAVFSSPHLGLAGLKTIVRLFS